jgi:hypothetical protein
MAKNNDDERIKAIVQRAIGITKDIEDPYRLKAFEIVLSRFLAAAGVLDGFTEKIDEKKPLAETKKGDTPLEAKIGAFAAKCNLSQEQGECLISSFGKARANQAMVLPTTIGPCCGPASTRTTRPTLRHFQKEATAHSSRPCTSRKRL